LRQAYDYWQDQPGSLLQFFRGQTRKVFHGTVHIFREKWPVSLKSAVPVLVKTKLAPTETFSSNFTSFYTQAQVNELCFLIFQWQMLQNAGSSTSSKVFDERTRTDRTSAFSSRCFKFDSKLPTLLQTLNQVTFL
jgi:hypothetical protein